MLIPLAPQEDGSETQNELPDSEDGYETTWHDVALSIGAELMAQVREEVLKQLGYTTSAVRAMLCAENSIYSIVHQGIARNKFLAKVCSC